MKYSGKRGLASLGMGAAALVLSATQAFAVSTVMDTADVYTYGSGSGGGNTDYGLKFDFSSVWGDFATAMTTDGLSSAFLSVDIKPSNAGVESDRFRVFETPGTVTSNLNDKLIPLFGEDKSHGVLTLKDLGYEYDQGDLVIGTDYTIDIELLSWYSTADLTNLLLANNGVLNIGYADDSWVYGGTLTLTSPYTAPAPTPQPPIANPEPATFVLFGSGLIGLAAWRKRKDKSQN